MAGAALGSEIRPLVWGFLTCSVITCCRQVVLLDAFAPWFSWHQRFTWRQAAAFPGSDLNASELVVSSRVPKCLHRIGSFGPQNGGQKARRKTRPLSLASTVPCLRGAVELLLTGDQHKPCASFNQQACKNTTSVAEGKRKTPQKIASKGAKICKKCHHFGVQKWTRFGVCHYFLKQTSPQNGSIFGPQNGGIFCIFLCLLMQFFVGFSVCLLLRMLYSYMPVD